MSKFRDLTLFVKGAVEALPEFSDIPVWDYDESDCQKRIQAGVEKLSGLFVSVSIPGGEGEHDLTQREQKGPHFPKVSIFVDLWANPIIAKHATVSAPLTQANRDPMDLLETIMQGVHRLPWRTGTEQSPVHCRERIYFSRWGVMPKRHDKDPFTVYRAEFNNELTLTGTL